MAYICKFRESSYFSRHLISICVPISKTSLRCVKSWCRQPYLVIWLYLKALKQFSIFVKIIIPHLWTVWILYSFSMHVELELRYCKQENWNVFSIPLSAKVIEEKKLCMGNQNKLAQRNKILTVVPIWNQYPKYYYTYSIIIIIIWRK